MQLSVAKTLFLRLLGDLKPKSTFLVHFHPDLRIQVFVLLLIVIWRHFLLENVVSNV